MNENEIVVMGVVGSPFGVRGWFHVHADTQYPDSLLDYPVWYLGSEGNWSPYKVESAELHAKGVVAKLEGVGDRDVAALLRKKMIAVPRAELPEPEADEYYWADLIGLSVVNQQGELLGRVAELLETGANDVLVVRDETTERLIPFVGTVVLSVDLPSAVITVDWGMDY